MMAQEAYPTKKPPLGGEARPAAPIFLDTLTEKWMHRYSIGAAGAAQ